MEVEINESVLGKIPVLSSINADGKKFTCSTSREKTLSGLLTP